VLKNLFIVSDMFLGVQFLRFKVCARCWLLCGPGC
jgi:hypothetical protein